MPFRLLGSGGEAAPYILLLVCDVDCGTPSGSSETKTHSGSASIFLRDKMANSP